MKIKKVKWTYRLTDKNFHAMNSLKSITKAMKQQKK